MIRGEGKPWAYDPEWITAQCLHPVALTRYLLDCGCSPPFGTLPLPSRWFALPLHVQDMRAMHGLLSPKPEILWCMSRPRLPTEYRTPAAVLVHQATGAWHDWEHLEKGEDLLRLAQIRHGITQAKAAWRVAKLLGFRRPVPPT